MRYAEHRYAGSAEEVVTEEQMGISKAEYAARSGKGGDLLLTLTPLMQQTLGEGMEAFITTFGKCLLKQMVKNFFG